MTDSATEKKDSDSGKKGHCNPTSSDTDRTSADAVQDITGFGELERTNLVAMDQ